MTSEELAAARKMGENCRTKGCRCLARCYHCFNKWWMEKADACTHPNLFPADDEWWGDLPPIVGGGESALNLRPKRTCPKGFTQGNLL